MNSKNCVRKPLLSLSLFAWAITPFSLANAQLSAEGKVVAIAAKNCPAVVNEFKKKAKAKAKPEIDTVIESIFTSYEVATAAEPGSKERKNAEKSAATEAREKILRVIDRAESQASGKKEVNDNCREAAEGLRAVLRTMELDLPSGEYNKMKHLQAVATQCDALPEPSCPSARDDGCIVVTEGGKMQSLRGVFNSQKGLVQMAKSVGATGQEPAEYQSRKLAFGVGVKLGVIKPIEKSGKPTEKCGELLKSAKELLAEAQAEVTDSIPAMLTSQTAAKKGIVTGSLVSGKELVTDDKKLDEEAK